jgi:hypothetical protein
VAKTKDGLKREEEEKALREHKILDYSHGALRQQQRTVNGMVRGRSVVFIMV